MGVKTIVGKASAKVKTINTWQRIHTKCCRYCCFSKYCLHFLSWTKEPVFTLPYECVHGCSALTNLSDLAMEKGDFGLFFTLSSVGMYLILLPLPMTREMPYATGIWFQRRGFIEGDFVERRNRVRGRPLTCLLTVVLLAVGRLHLYRMMHLQRKTRDCYDHTLKALRNINEDSKANTTTEL